MTRRVFKGLALVSIPLVALFVYRGLFDLWFTDIDTFPLISTARIDSVSSIIDIFTLPLMQGLMPNALFYRPVASISWGIDASLWGLNPLGYHLTDLVLHIVNCLLLFFLLRDISRQLSLGREESNSHLKRDDFAALAAAFIFAIHPIAMEVVPAIARRADLLYGFFLLLMLRSLRMAMVGKRALDIGLATFFCVLAFASKDSALGLPAIAIAFVFCFADATTIRDRVAQCARICWPMVIAAPIFLSLRMLVLGGIGGYAEIELWANLPFTNAVSASITPLACAIFMPGDLDVCANYTARQIQIATLVAFVILLLISWRARGGQASNQSLRFLAFAILSMFAIFLLHAASGTPITVRTLYTTLPFFSITLIWGAIIVFQSIFAPGKISKSSIAERAVQVVACIILVVAIGSVLRGAWSGQYIGEWNASSELDKRALTDLAEGMETVPPDSVVYLVNFPWADAFRQKPMRERPMLLEHSVQGFVDLAFPDKHLEVAALSYAKINVDDPADLTSSISFQPNPAKIDIQVGPEGIPIPFAWFISYPRKSPWRDNTYTNFRSERRLLVDLNPEVSLKDKAVFFVYSGGRVVRKGTTPWILKHVPSEH